MDGIKGDFEYQALVLFTNRPEPMDRMTADIAVQPFQFLVSETEIGLAHRQQIGALIGIAVPAAEGEVGIEGGALPFPRCAYMSTQSTSSGSRFHLYQRPVRRPGT